MDANHFARQRDRFARTIIGMVVAIWQQFCCVAAARAIAENFGEN